ncbi:MAG TPA: FMN-binding protein [Pseudomonadales bacterium]
MAQFAFAPPRWGFFDLLSQSFTWQKKVVHKLGITIFMLSLACFVQAQDQAHYLSTKEFLDLTFKNSPYQMKSLWLDQAELDQAEKILGHPFNGFRVRYWAGKHQTAWVLDEIGKERPITIGVSIQDNKIAAIHILAFRESRGWEIRNDFFTRQFDQAFLNHQYKLSAQIDGISGATLSVRAVKKVAALALYFHQLS